MTRPQDALTRHKSIRCGCAGTIEQHGENRISRRRLGRPGSGKAAPALARTALMTKWSPVNVFVMRTQNERRSLRACEVAHLHLERAATAASKENRSHFVWSNSLPLKSSPHRQRLVALAGCPGD